VALLVGERLAGEVVADLLGRASGVLADAAALLEAEGLTPADVDVIAASLGPGSFTGLRVGLATAKGLAWAAGAQLVGVSSLETLAAGVPDTDGLIAPVLDARRGEVYGALFRGRTRLLPDSVAPPEAWATRLAEAAGDEPLVLVGDGLARYPEALSAALGARLLPPPEGTPDHPSPAALARLAREQLLAGRTLDPATALPNYVRSHGAVPPKDMRR